MLLNTKTRDKFIYILKLITYFDTFELNREYEQRGGATAPPPNTTEKAPTIEQDKGGTVNGVNVQSDNNFIVYILRSFLKTIKRVSVYISNMLGKYAMLFIFAATFPAIPFFACMGFMYATVKYAMFKFREI